MKCSNIIVCFCVHYISTDNYFHTRKMCVCIIKICCTHAYINACMHTCTIIGLKPAPFSVLRMNRVVTSQAFYFWKVQSVGRLFIEFLVIFKATVFKPPPPHNDGGGGKSSMNYKVCGGRGRKQSRKVIWLF